MAHSLFHDRLMRAAAAGLLSCAATLAGAQPAQQQRAADPLQLPASPSQAAKDGAPQFDKEAARGTVRALVREGELGDGSLPRDPAPNRPGVLSTRGDYALKFARGFEQARRPSCATAYAGAGLLAIFPLLYDTITDSGCRW